MQGHPLQRLLDLLPPGEVRDFMSGPGGWVVVGVTVLVVVLIALAVLGRIWRSLFRRRSAPPPDPDRALIEQLAEYPLAGPLGPRQLAVEGVPARVRLIVVAPMGREHAVDSDAVEGLLDQVMHGMAEVIRYDRPRIRIWPPQLSVQGFTAKFHRLIHRPEAEGQPSHWVLVAGQTPARPRPLLVGLALWCGEANLIGRLALEPARWNDLLRILRTPES